MSTSSIPSSPLPFLPSFTPSIQGVEPTSEHYKHAKFIQIAASIVKITAGSYLPSILGSSSVTGVFNSMIPEWASWTSFLGSTSLNLAGKCFVANGTLDLLLFGLIPLLTQLPFWSERPKKLTFSQKLVTWLYYPTEIAPNGDRTPIPIEAIRYPGEILNSSLSFFGKYITLGKIGLKFLFGRQTLMDLSSKFLAKEFWVFPELKSLRLVHSLQLGIDAFSDHLKSYTEEKITYDQDSGEITQNPQLLTWMQKKLLEYVEVIGIELQGTFGDKKRLMHLLCTALKSTEKSLQALDMLTRNGNLTVEDKEMLHDRFLQILGKNASFEKYKTRIYEKFTRTFAPPSPGWFPAEFSLSDYFLPFFAKWLVAPVVSSHTPNLEWISEKISKEYPLLSKEVQQLEQLLLTSLWPILYSILDDLLDEINSKEEQWEYKKRMRIEKLPKIVTERSALLRKEKLRIENEESKNPVLERISSFLEKLSIIPTKSEYAESLRSRLEGVDHSLSALNALKETDELPIEELYDLFDLSVRELTINFLDFLANHIDDLVTITEEELAIFLNGEEHDIEAKGALGRLLAGYIRLNQKADLFIYRKVSSLILHSSEEYAVQKKLLGLLIAFIKNDIVSELSFRGLAEATASAFEAQFHEKEKFIVVEKT